MVNRPIGVTVSVSVLGLLGLTQVAGAASLLIESSKPIHGGWFPGLVTLVVHVLILVLLAMAAWWLTTAAGLFRMRRWATYSILAIAVCMLIFGFFYGLWMFSLLSKQHFHGTPFLGVSIGVTSFGLGLAWLIYFGRDTTARWFTVEYQREFPANPRFAASMLNLTVVPPPRPEPPPQ